jgi:hypothetical protein
MRFWAMSLAIAVCGGFIAIERFAFNPTAVAWIAFGVAIVAIGCAPVATGSALTRANHAFAGLSALGVLVGAWTIIAMLVFRPPTAAWLAFADGVALLLLALRALALHETTVERVVHALELGGRGESRSMAVAAAPGPTPVAVSASTQGVGVSATMRSWLRWLTDTGLGIAGAFVVLMTVALTSPGSHHVSPRWIALGIDAVVRRSIWARRRRLRWGSEGGVRKKK